MPDGAVAAAGAAGGAGGAAPQQRQGSSFLSTVLRMVFMWGLMNYMKGNGVNKQAVTQDPLKFSAPAFAKGELVDMYAYVMESPSVPGGRFAPSDLVWEEQAVRIGVADPRNTTITIHPSQAVQNNGSLWLHMVFARAGASIDPTDPAFDEDDVFGRSFNLIAYRPRPKNTTGVSLLSADKQAREEAAAKVAAEGPREIISFFKPNLTIQIVDHFQTYPRGKIPAQVSEHLQYNRVGNHFPVVFFNEFWLLKDYLVPMNTSVQEVALHLDLGYASMTWWQLLLQMDKSFDMQAGMGLQQEGDRDEIKRVFLEGNPYLLGLTMVVSLLHTVFDMLAFKNDVGFWRQNKSMEGLSARSVVINAGCQLVILLYLLDSETSMVVLFSAFTGTAIEFWKVTKAMHVSLVPTFPYLKFEDRASYNTNNTKQHDADAMRYLSYVLYPLVAGYAVYSLIYKTHKSWYSWIVNSLVGAVYMFGFILMCPQLYLNYKLKSVAHMPWRQMTYKFLTTIIDDLFAFVIKMPLLHRISVFRDDVIFLIYLYQRWVYRVDMKRTNEFGFAGEAPTEEAAQEPAPALEGPAAVPAGAGAAGGAGAGAKKGGKRKDAGGQAAKVAAADVAANGSGADGSAAGTGTGEDVKKDK